MISFSEVVNRALTGPACTERDFDLKIFSQKLSEVVKNYGIKYDPETPIPSDNTLADDVFKAAMEFYLEVGTYCPDTERMIKFNEHEIKEALKTAPNGAVFGEGKDAKKLVARKPESTSPPWCSVGAAGALVSSEEIFMSIMQAYGLIPLADSITTPGLTRVNGVKIVAGSPLEVFGAIRTVVLSREALRRSGRPGLPIMNGIATAVTDTATIAGTQFGMRPSDCWEIGSIAEMKIDFERLNKIAYLLSMGANILAEVGPILGGYCGGPEGTAIATTAYTIQGILVQRGVLLHPFPIHFRYGCTTRRDVLWALSVSTQAISRNSHFPLLDLGYLASGPMTRMCFYETASWVIASIVSGASIEAEGIAKATNIDYLSPMEPMFATEVAYAVLGMKRGDANDMVKSLLSKYEDKIEDPPLGKKYQECFNVESATPSQDYSKLYADVKREIADYGIRFE